MSSKKAHIRSLPQLCAEVLRRLPPGLASLAAPDAAAAGGRAAPGARLRGADALGAQSVGRLEEVGKLVRDSLEVWDVG